MKVAREPWSSMTLHLCADGFEFANEMFFHCIRSCLSHVRLLLFL